MRLRGGQMPSGIRKPPFMRSAYNYDPVEAGEVDCVKEWDPSLTQQSQAEEADINTIVRRFGLTGQLPTNVRVPTYGDFEDIWDYQSAMNAVIDAQRSFMRMSGEVRRRFHDDPAEFVAFCSDEGNKDEMRKLGLLKPEEPKAGPEAPPKGPAADSTPTT